MSRLVVPQMLATGSLVTGATALRIGFGCADLVAQRTRPLVGHALTASFGGPETRTAQAAFRDDLMALARDSAEISWRELRRGLADFDSFTRPRGEPGEQPHRPHRVKL